MRTLTRKVALARHHDDMARLLRALDGLPNERRDAPIYRVWTVKDIVVHIAAWDDLLARAIDKLLAGERPAFGRTSVFNKRAVDAGRPLAYDAALRTALGAHQALMGRIAAVSDSAWAATTPYRWGDRTPMTIGSLFGYTYQGETHYGGHAVEIERWLGAPP